MKNCGRALLCSADGTQRLWKTQGGEAGHPQPAGEESRVDSSSLAPGAGSCRGGRGPCSPLTTWLLEAAGQAQPHIPDPEL